jgi:hypothetical protein
LTSIERTAGDSVVGAIWIAAGETDLAFPEVGWSDFPVILLSTWIPALRQLLARGQAAECHFLDGPYHFTASAVDAGRWRLACFEAREAPSVTNAVAEWSTAGAAFFESAIAMGKAVLGYCDARGWWNDDTDRLRQALAFTDPDRTN